MRSTSGGANMTDHNLKLSTVLRKELENYLSQIESCVFSEDTSYFDENASRLMDCVRYLLEG